MSIQHKLIPDSQLHEPKGVVGATNHQVYVSNGLGTGTWKRIDTTDIQGLSGDGGSTNKVPRSDGANGLVLKTNRAYGVMTVTNNTNAFSTTAAVDGTLNSTSDYVLYTGTGAPLIGEALFGGTSFSTNRITVPVSGTYKIKLWGVISGFPSTSAKVGLRYRINGGATWGTRPLVIKSNAGGDNGVFTSFELVNLSASDYVQLYVASSVTGSLTINNLNVTVNLIMES